jgi:hypothetical protein
MLALPTLVIGTQKQTAMTKNPPIHMKILTADQHDFDI